MAAEAVAALCARLAGEDMSDAAAAAEALAELGKDDAVRAEVGAMPAVWPALVSLLKRSNDVAFSPARQQSLRAVGNLCYENNENRKQLLEAGGVAALAGALSALTTAERGPAEGEAAVSTGALLNAANADAAMATQLVEAGAVKSLVWLLTHAPGESEVEVAVRALVEMSAVEAAATEIQDTAPVGVLVRLMSDAPDDEAAESAIALLRLISRKDSALIRFAEQATLDRLIADSQQTSRPEVAKTAALIVSVALADDLCLAKLFPEEEEGGDVGVGGGTRNDAVLDMFVAWIGMKELVDLQIAGAIGIGNFCRSDAHAERVGAREAVLSGLLEMSQHDWGSVKHAALSSLKNIVKLDANKARLFSLDLPTHVNRLVHDPQAPVQYLTASLLRTVTASLPPETVQQLAVGDAQLLPRLVHLSRSEEQAVHAEATRALLNLVKFSRSADVAELVVKAGAVGSFMNLLGSEHDMLQTEASVVLAIGSSMSPAFRGELATEEPLGKLLEAVANARRVEVVGNLLNVFATLLTLSAADLLADHRTRIFQTTREVAAKPLTQQVPAAAAFAAAVLKLEGAAVSGGGEQDKPGK